MKMNYQYFFLALVLLDTVNAAERIFNFRNLCNKPVWFGFAGGSVSAKSSQSTGCKSDNDCYQGTKCVQTGATADQSQCFWNNPTPSDGNYKVDSNSFKDVKIPVYDNGYDLIWSGSISGRTNCNANGCETANCGPNDGACQPSRGFSQPATQAEMTLLKGNVDFYDVEVINGVHMAISMGPTNTAAGGPYTCGNPGAKHPRTSVGSCDWNLKPPSVDYNWVTAGGAVCNDNSNCANGNVCGLSFNPGQQNLFKKTCGTQLGFWTADQVCGTTPSYGAPFNCQDKLQAPQDYLTNTNLYMCTGTGSCYQNGASDNCCGCANWDEEGLNVPGFPVTERCKNKNPNWTNRIKSTLKWLKQACPTSYTYPYDDMSSTFTCANMQGGQNTVNYQITFCPQNEP